jgi:hypothetical protein
MLDEIKLLNCFQGSIASIVTSTRTRCSEKSMVLSPLLHSFSQLFLKYFCWQVHKDLHRVFYFFTQEILANFISSFISHRVSRSFWLNDTIAIMKNLLPLSLLFILVLFLLILGLLHFFVLLYFSIGCPCSINQSSSSSRYM